MNYFMINSIFNSSSLCLMFYYGKFWIKRRHWRSSVSIYFFDNLTESLVDWIESWLTNSFCSISIIGWLEALAFCSCDHLWSGASRAKTSMGGLRGANMGYYTLNVNIINTCIFNHAIWSFSVTLYILISR